MGLERRYGRRALLRVLTGALGVAAHLPQAGATGEEIRFGLTPVFLTSDLDLLGSLKTYIERATRQPVRLITRRTYQEITSLLISGQLDAAWICGFPFVANADQLDLVAVPVWQGRPLYQSYVITAADRQVNGLEDLRADIHAFSDPDSNSGWLVTAAALARMGTSPGRFFRQTFFTYGHRNVIRAVSTGLAMSGSVDGYVFEVMREAEKDLVAGTKIVRRSDWVGFPPIACPIAASKTPTIERLRHAFAAMAEDADGRAVLAMLRLTGFEAADRSLFNPIADQMRLVRGIGG